MRTQEEFNECFGPSFWKKINESLIPFSEKHSIAERDILLNGLYIKLATRIYQTSFARNYIISNKHSGVARIVPTFSVEDYCTYFYCIKCIEEDLCAGRIEGTFGGWTLGNGFKESEESEICENEESIAYIYSAPENSYNPYAWRKYWKEFQKMAYLNYQDEDYLVMVKLDIANFYDNIRLDLLQDKIRNKLYTSNSLNELGDEIEILFYFLKTWNRKLEGYKDKTVGIPQDELADCSRILANFYIQSYDKIAYEVAFDKGAAYLRYADDQIFFCKDKSIADSLLFEASKELSKIGLNINSSKVEFFSREEFSTYWSFDIFELLSDENTGDIDKLNTAIELYFERRDFKKFRSSMVLNRLLSIGITKARQDLYYKILAEVLKPDFLEKCDKRNLRKIYQCLSTEEKNKMIETLLKISETNNFNSFHYNLLAFVKREKISTDLSKIEERIRVLSI